LCEAHGVDRPIGFPAYTSFGTAEHAYWKDRIVLLTKSGIEKALAGQPGRAGASPGVFVMPLLEDGGEARAMYELFFKVEQVP
jgi:hypothetical protein